MNIGYTDRKFMFISSVPEASNVTAPYLRARHTLSKYISIIYLPVTRHFLSLSLENVTKQLTHTNKLEINTTDTNKLRKQINHRRVLHTQINNRLELQTNNIL